MPVRNAHDQIPLLSRVGPAQGVQGGLVDSVPRPEYQERAPAEVRPKAQTIIPRAVQDDYSFTRWTEYGDRRVLEGETPDAEYEAGPSRRGQERDLIAPLRECNGQVAKRRLRSAEWAFQGGRNVVVPINGIEESNIHVGTRSFRQVQETGENSPVYCSRLPSFFALRHVGNQARHVISDLRRPTQSQ